MKRVFLQFALLLILITSYSYAQSGWFWQNPLPQGNTLYGSHFLNSNTGFIVGGGGSILRTTDGGISFALIGNISNLNFKAIFFFNTLTGYIGGDHSTILKTTNGGLNWIQQLLVEDNYSRTINCIKFVNPNTGLAGGYNCLYRTTNGGSNWDTIGFSTVHEVKDIWFLDESTGYLISNRHEVSSYGRIYKTTNNGRNWSLSYSDYKLFEIIQFFNFNTGYAVGSRESESIIVKTTNGGINWSSRNYSNIFITDAVFLNEDTAYFAAGSVLKTTDGGTTFSTSFQMQSNFYSKIFYGDFNNIIAGGSSHFLIKSSNAGASWANVFQNPFDVPIRSLHAPSSNIVYAAGDSGLIAKTTNGGQIWIKQQSNVFSTLKCVKFFDNMNGIACGDNSTMLRTTNGGLNWLINSSFSGLNFNALDLADSITAYTGTKEGQNGKLFKTTNRGADWQQLSTTNNNYIGYLEFINKDFGFFSSGSLVLRTTNGGLNWTSYNINFSCNTISFPENTLIGYASGSSISKTTNGGLSWFLIKPNQTAPSNKAYFINNNTGYYTYGSLSVNLLMRTTNGGINWVYLTAPYERFFEGIFFTDSVTGYFFGDKGILKTTNGGGNPIGIQPVSVELPNNFLLSQNYPNPFNPQTKIKFDVPKASFTKLIVYDLLGREITTLVNEELKPGTYQVDWDATEFSSGVYFYKIIAGDPSTGSGQVYSETKKMVLMK